VIYLPHNFDVIISNEILLWKTDYSSQVWRIRKKSV